MHKCHVVIIEDLELPGLVPAEDLLFAAVPRVGESVNGYGTVVEVLHFANREGDPDPEDRVQLFISRSAHANRT